MMIDGKKSQRERRRQVRSDLIGLQEAADYCDVSYRTIRRWVSTGRLNAVRIGPKLLKVRTDEIDKIIKPVGAA